MENLSILFTLWINIASNSANVCDEPVTKAFVCLHKVEIVLGLFQSVLSFTELGPLRFVKTNRSSYILQK